MLHYWAEDNYFKTLENISDPTDRNLYNNLLQTWSLCGCYNKCINVAVVIIISIVVIIIVLYFCILFYRSTGKLQY